MPLNDIVCSAPACDRPVSARGLCKSHYSADFYHRKQATETRPCRIPDCPNPVRTVGLCNRHYAQKQRTGDPLFVAQSKPKRLCSVDGCETVVLARGLCNKHLIRLNKHGDVNAVSSPSDTRNVFTCQQCGTPFPGKPFLKRQFCSHACYAANKAIPDRLCPVCGKTFHASPSQLGRGVGKYCSIECFGISKRGPELCSVEGCGRKHLANGFCRRHDPKTQETGREIQRRRRAAKNRADAQRVYEDDIYARDRGICQICKKPLPRGEVTLDHILPISRGGAHRPDNVQIAHKSCNSRRNNRGPAQLRLL